MTTMCMYPHILYAHKKANPQQTDAAVYLCIAVSHIV